jgi:hypothetical protein
MTTIALIIATFLSFAAALVPVSIGLAYDARTRRHALIPVAVDASQRSQQAEGSGRALI